MASPAPSQRTRSTADERRETILEAAQHVFAARGLHGTPTLDVAKAAGISQAYLFRLFPTKAELFAALTDRVSKRVYDTFAEAAASAKAADEDVLSALGAAYIGLLSERTLLLNQLHAHAACDDPAIREQVRAGFARLVELVERESGADAAAVRVFFAHGMLLNVLAAMGAADVDARWARHLLPGVEEHPC